MSSQTKPFRGAVKFKGAKKATHYPKELIKIQFKGFLFGPIGYIQSLLSLHKRPSRTRDESEMENT